MPGPLALNVPMSLAHLKTHASARQQTTAKKKLLIFAIVCTLGGVLLWWYEDGRFSTSAECKVAREQHAELEVGSTIYARLYRESRQFETFVASQKNDRSCKKWPPS